VDFLHRDENFQASMRVLLAKPCRTEFLLLTRPSMLEKDTTAMLSRRFTQIHTIMKGFYVTAKKGNWSRGVFHAIQSLQDWTLWAPKQFHSSIR
jgi:Txe/YoeB family toxin of Txe-Axe toxin-antitoxin module